MHDIIDEAELLDAPGGEQLRVRFNGPFEGREVRWDARLVTLAAWRRHHPTEPVRQNFITIGEESDQGIAITVGLNLECIDLPALRKTMLMIRQYKRLARGRHDYGPVVS